MEQSEDVHISPAFEQLSAEAISRLDEPSTSEEKPTCAKRKSSFDMSSVSTTGKRQRDRALKSVSMDTDDEFMDDSTSEDAAEVTPWVEQFESMSRSCQKSALFALIGSLGLQHVRQLRHLIEPHFQKDFLTHLPMEIALQLVSCLPPADIVRAASVSRFWRLVCEDDRLWRIKCNEKKLDRTLLHQTPTTRVQGAWESTALASGVVVMDHVMGPDLLRLKQEREVKHGSVFTRSKWKSLFLRYCRIQANWRSRPIGGSCILRGHDEHVITCLQINDDMIVTGSDDNTLKVWCISKGCLLFSLVGHSGGVWTSQLSKDGRFIVSGSTDRTVKVWSATDGQGTLLRTLVGHTSTVRCMSLHGNILVSGSRDTTLRAWCIESGRCLQQLLGHQAAVRCVQFDGTRVVSGAYDFSVKVWDLESGKCYYTLHGHSNRVYSLLLDAERNLVVSGSLDTSIRVWDISTGTCICVLNGHTSLTSGMQLRGDILVSCNADSTVRVWNIRTGTCVHRLHGQNGHSSAITSLQYMENGLVATSSDDGTVKLWDVDKGIFLRDLIRLNSGGNGGCIWRLKATENLLACAVGSRNGTEDTKLILVDFDSSFA